MSKAFHTVQTAEENCLLEEVVEADANGEWAHQTSITGTKAIKECPAIGTDTDSENFLTISFPQLI